MVELRPYQLAAMQSITDSWGKENRKILAVLPTGTGKTILFSHIVKEKTDEGHRVLILAHRGELLQQAKDKLKLAVGLDSALEKADSTTAGTDTNVVVASVQSMMQDKRLAQFPSDHFNYIIVDEAHHSPADSYQKVLAHFPDAYVLGVTATPERGDGKNLLDYYDSLAFEYTLLQAIQDGYLCPIHAQMIPLKLDISKVSIANGDYAAGQLGDSLDAFLYQIANEMKTYCKDRKTVVFLPLIKTSQKLCNILKKAGFKAAEINGKSKNRSKILRDFEKGKFHILCNSMLLTEGWDCPSVDCIVILRPTKSPTLYRQMVGRGTRLHLNKKNLLLLDFLWITKEHDLCHPSCLISTDTNVQEQINNQIQNSETEINILAAEKEASHRMQLDMESRLLKELKRTRNYESKLVQLIDFACGIASEELIALHKTAEETRTRLTENQFVFLASHGIDAASVPTPDIAEKVIHILHTRASSGLATPKQIRRLEYYGFCNVGTWTKKKAYEIIKRIADNDWKVPEDLKIMIEENVK